MHHRWTVNLESSSERIHCEDRLYDITGWTIIRLLPLVLPEQDSDVPVTKHGQATSMRLIFHEERGDEIHIFVNDRPVASTHFTKRFSVAIAHA